MKHALLGVVALALSACSPQAEKVYTVDELLADETLLAKVIGECRNEPGALRGTANCQPAEAADGKLRLERMRKSLGG
ncbi:EexN family lipoprotein [Rhizobium leguminosarum]|uniref:EexN family lipoprotein n=1 Tax=Rhizobium leguminosarum TaxID=384 RepID=A0A6P0BEP7_RHILE|nr:EexN family lipoprotein [Rhizobium leguminosarum]MBY5435642.1 EexN family lipoprotein [Rhizobium leguminosarum]NEI37354.1 EexN family lipoprotein [Rhizobium leguminosarum]NEI43921.1 EexN family lipoprotein [Rhizobium leguminosarum]